MSDRVHSAIQNNMDWYQAQCHAHNIENVRTTSAWYSILPMPPLHSNLILTHAQDLPLIEEVGAHLSSEWSIKDASGRLDLSPFGFDVLFNANWFAREPADCDAPAGISRVASDETFDQWVTAWGEDTEVFRDNFWHQADVEFYHDEHWQGGIAANVSHDAIGITNPWGTKASINDCIQNIAHTHPTLPIVGYDHMPDIEAMTQLGFRSTAPLAIWIKKSSG